jgi:four helix bundle protein
LSYQKLDIWQRSYRLFLDCHKLSLTLPAVEKYAMADQLRRAALSIPLNIAEGYGHKEYQRDYVRFLVIALGSKEEVCVLLQACEDLGYADGSQISKLLNEYKVVGAGISSLKRVVQNEIGREKCNV